MAFVVAALEVSDKIQTVGAFAGFAAILGLAVLSVLYFGQAREVKRLREWAGRAPERAAEMQDRVATDASRRVVAQPVTQARPPAALPATPGAAAAARPAGAPAPAGVGAGAVGGAAAGAGAAGGAAAGAAAAGGTGAAGGAPVPPAAPPAAPGAPPAAPGGAPATKAPSVDGETTEVKPSTDQPTVLQPAVPGAELTRPAAASGATPGAGAATPPAAAAPPAAPGAAAASPPAAPSPPTSPQATPTGPATPAGGRTSAPAARPEPSVPLRSARASREAPAATAQAPSSSPTGATIAIVAAVAAILVAVVLVVTGVIGGDDSGPARNVIVPTAPEPATSTNGTPAPLNRAGVSVVVLNGTGVPNLAREASDKLGRDGYRLAAAGNRGDATVTKTVVLFAPGNERAARDVVRLLKLGTVGPLDAGTEVVAQPHAKPAGTKPEVVVTLGADAAQS